MLLLYQKQWSGDDDMKYVLIANPNAGKGQAVELLRSEIEKLPQKADCEILETEGILHATRLVKEWAAAHPGEEARFIACGGDGTINEVFSGAIGLRNVSVSVFPCGSGNDFVKVFGGMEKFSDLRKILEAPVQKLDVLKANDRYCINVLNFGFDTMVAKTMNERRDVRGYGKQSDYYFGIAKAFFTAMKTKATVAADGEVINPDGLLTLCTLGNGQYVGGAFKVAPRARTDDGLIEVCLVKPIKRTQFPALMGPYQAGKHLDDPKFKDIITYRQATKIVVDAAPGFAYSLDGEIIQAEHVEVEMLPGLLDLAVPV